MLVDVDLEVGVETEIDDPLLSEDWMDGIILEVILAGLQNMFDYFCARNFLLEPILGYQRLTINPLVLKSLSLI